jgi:hypothetical protein
LTVASRAVLDRLQRLARPLGVTVEHALRRARLETDHADAVRGPLVELARDPRPLLWYDAFQVRTLWSSAL